MRPITCPLLLAVLCLLLPTAAFAEEPPRDPAADLPAEVRAALEQMDRQLEDVHSLRARFVKARYTPLLKKPLISHGRLRIKDDWIRWDTLEPRASYTLLRSDEVQILYPDDKRLEIYPLDARFQEFSVGPLPRSAELIKRFDIQPLPASELLEDDPAADAASETAEPSPGLALRLVPKAEAVREHVDRIDVLLDPEAGHLRMLRIAQPDGTRTVYRFQDTELNPDLTRRDLELAPPPGTQIVRPYDHDQQ